MSPTIEAGGRRIFPVSDAIDQDVLINQGIAAFVYGQLPAAKQNRRAGNSPLIVRARAVTGQLSSSVVLSPQEGQILSTVEARSGILKSFKVIFLLDK